MPNKLDKFGVKYWLAVDAKNLYILNDFPYLDKYAIWPAARPLGEHVMLRLMEPFFDKGINSQTGSTILCETYNYPSQKQWHGPDNLPREGDKNVLSLSTLHIEVDIDQQTEKKIPETSKFYNGTGYGVDIAY
ncbi:hypothetical protein PR048_026953 [Dryococelus australis]|uniref:Uncharacterized protein n=1 Tax=Dryococelus australis TaxID=614101 RepID=A0ABQ9GMR7_9NEOP|nr:hypothetical protein PR048_026953 [Dryococelus australis]